jgi:hypothetical protein
MMIVGVYATLGSFCSSRLEIARAPEHHPVHDLVDVVHAAIMTVSPSWAGKPQPSRGDVPALFLVARCSQF